MSLLPKVIQYFRDCYQADFRAVHLLDFFGKKVSHRHILEDAELLTGSLSQVPVSSEWAAGIQKHLAVYGKEKTLFCCSFFLRSQASFFGKSKRVFAPLYLHPVNLIVEGGIYYLELEANRPIINPAFLECLNSGFGQKQISYDQFVEALPTGFIGFDACHGMESFFEKQFSELNISDLGDYPTLFNREQVAQVKKQKSKTKEVKLIPALGLGIMDKAVSSLGVLNELETMAKQSVFSPPIKALFGQSTTEETLPESSFVAPVTLSDAQQNIIHSAEKHTLTLAIGPPGTGKSFTIAALAVDFLVQRKSVLIAARNNQAVNVVADKIEADFGLKNVVVRAGKKDYKKSLRQRLKRLLFGMGVRKIDTKQIRGARASFGALEEKVTNLERVILNQEKLEIERGIFLKYFKNTLWQRWKKFWMERKMYNETPFWEQLFTLEKLTTQRHKQAHQLIQRTSQMQVHQALLQGRGDLQIFYNGLHQLTGQNREDSFNHIKFEKVLRAFPIWVVNTSDINRVLPLTAELFDLVIIDEATQCDLASALPILFRGKKAAIVGDPKQLRHVSFLAKKQQTYFQKQNNLETTSSEILDFRNKSLLDLAFDAIKNQNQVHFLDEHFRSLPDIIAFSNTHFYDNNLKIMTANPVNWGEQSVFLYQVKGKQDAKGHNELEAQAILKKVQKILKYESSLKKTLCQSIGILSPFRAQVNFLQSLFNEAVSLEDFQKHNILIGTPHEFQGEERDFMFLSFVVDKETHPSTFVYLNRVDVFNVSITRARSLQHLYFSVDPNDLKPHYLLTKLLKSHIESEKSMTKNNAQIEHDDFMAAVVEVLKKWEISEIYEAYHIAGLEVDLVVVHQEQTYCIDLVGYPGAYREAVPLNKWKMLSRVNLTVFALPYSSWILEKTWCLKELKKFLKLI